MLYKYLLLLLVLLLFIPHNLSYSQQQINFTRGDQLAENLLHLCSIATIFPINASAAVNCQDDLYLFSKRFCATYHDQFDVCRTGIIDSFLRGQGYTPTPDFDSSITPYPKNP